MPIPLHCDGHTCPLADHLPDIIVCYDAEGRRTYVSPEYCRIFGIGPDQVIGRRIGEFVPPAVAGQPMEQLAEAVHGVLATGKQARSQIAWSDADGRHMCYELLASPTFDAEGRITSVLTVSRDISEIRETTDRLILLDFALNRVHEALYIVDEQARFVLVNDEACRALGYSRDEFRAMSVFDIDPDFPPEAWAKHWEQLQGQRALTLETQHRAKDGRMLPVELLTKYFRYGSHAYNLALARDISDRRRADEIKRRHRGEFEVLVENSPDTVVRYDRNCLRIYANPAYIARAGKPLEAVLGRRPSEGSDSPALLDYERCLRQIVASGQGCEYELCWKSASGKSLTCLIRLTPEFDPAGRVTSIIAIGRDISALKETQKRLERAEALAHVGHWEWDYARRESFLSAEACRIFGHEPGWRPSLEEVLATVLEEDRERILQSAREALTLGVGEVSYAYRVMRRDGKIAYLHSVIQIEYSLDKPGYIRRLIGTTQDVTKLKTYEYHVHDLTYTDMLTSLPNRTLFIDRARHAIAEAQQHGRMLGVMLVDLDRFKAVNDGCGHAIGDAVLVEVGQRLRAAVRGYDTVARLSGDEFAILLPNIHETANLARVSQKIFDSLALPIRQKDKEIFITPSIGIALYPDDAGEIGTLLQYADAALGHAKERGRSRHCFYTRDLTAKAHERVMLEAALRQALRRDELCLHYQPQIDLASGDLVGFEALMRWQHPEQGMIPPIRFIPVAEHTGLIAAMGEWALATAFRQVSRWNREREKPLRMAVNLSSRQFGDGNLAERIIAIAEETGCQPAWIELEITESLLLDGNDDVHQTLHKLAEAGYSIAIDDFGTGYSALGYLHRFPIHTLKIDRSFINGLLENCRTAELVKAILSMAHALHLTVVAEGIEHRGEEAFVQAHGGQIGQGYLYSKPQAAEYFEKRVAGHA